MSDIEEAGDELPQILVFDCGACEWKAGFVGDDGPACCMPTPAAAAAYPNSPTSSKAFEMALEELETEASEHAILVAERPGFSEAERFSVASMLLSG